MEVTDLAVRAATVAAVVVVDLTEVEEVVPQGAIMEAAIEAAVVVRGQWGSAVLGLGLAVMDLAQASAGLPSRMPAAVAVVAVLAPVQAALAAAGLGLLVLAATAPLTRVVVEAVGDRPDHPQVALVVQAL